jgi:hypothetical protein
VCAESNSHCFRDIRILISIYGMHAAIRVTSQLANPPVSKGSHSLFPIHESAGREIRHRTIFREKKQRFEAIPRVTFWAPGYRVGRRRADQREPIFFSADHGNRVHSAVIR